MKANKGQSFIANDAPVLSTFLRRNIKRIRRQGERGDFDACIPD
jgi:hypothetical protein